MADFVLTGERPPLLEPFRLDRFARVGRRRRRVPAGTPYDGLPKPETRR
jgi:hypothetical protein